MFCRLLCVIPFEAVMSSIGHYSAVIAPLSVSLSVVMKKSFFDVCAELFI